LSADVSPVRRKALWWEGFAKKVGFEPGMNERVIDNESGEFMERDKERGEET